MKKLSRHTLYQNRMSCSIPFSPVRAKILDSHVRSHSLEFRSSHPSATFLFGATIATLLLMLFSELSLEQDRKIICDQMSVN